MENNGKGIFYGVIGVATLVVAIIGATFAYFSASASDNSAITGTTAEAGGIGVEVTKLSTAATGGLIPMLDTDLQKGITGIDNSCVDANGNTVCQVYSIKVTNNGATTINVKGTMNLTLGESLTNMKWQLLTNATTVDGEATTVTGATSGSITDNTTLAGSGNTTFYVVIWLSETSENQDDEAGKSFSGNVSFSAVDASGGALSGVTATFTQGA